MAAADSGEMSKLSKKIKYVIVAAFVASAAACSSGTPEVTRAEETTPVVTATTTPSPEATTPEPVETTPAEVDGSRANPLQPGDSRKLSSESMWTISGGPTEVYDTYAILPLTLNPDWDSFTRQAEAQGMDPDAGIDPFFSLTVEFVTANGRSYNTMDDYSVTVPNDWFSIGTIYPPAEAVTGNVAVSVPRAEVEGGVWAVGNMQNDKVFIAAVPTQ